MTEQINKLTRRDLTKTILAGAAIAAVPSGALAATGDHKVQYAMVIDTRRCSGCHACSVACKAEFDVPLGFTRSWVESIEKGDFPHVTRNFLPRLCNQCSDPPCVRVCPTGATWKREEDGIIDIDPDKCIGCKYCMQACPYDARFINPISGTAEKCDFCLHRVSQGIEPSCVNTCQGKARVFGDINDPDSEVSRLVATNSVTVLRQGMGTKPNVYYIDADHSDERTSDLDNIRITTHRRQKERR